MEGVISVIYSFVVPTIIVGLVETMLSVYFFFKEENIIGSILLIANPFGLVGLTICIMNRLKH